jgi:hypothetical protein
MAKFTNLDGYEGLLELNKHLAVHSYLVGFVCGLRNILVSPSETLLV